MSQIDINTMNGVLSNIEFFTHEQEVWIRLEDGSMRKLGENDIEIVDSILEFISTFYPRAFSALSSEYGKCSRNRAYWGYRCVCRFIRCNFSALDSIPDVSSDLTATFEHVNCPIRSECPYDHVICRPEFDHRLSPAELRVMSLVYDGCPESEIGDILKLSPKTVHTHIRNAYARLGIHSRGEFCKFATKNKIFK